MLVALVNVSAGYSNQQSADNDGYAKDGQDAGSNSYDNEEESVTRILTTSQP